MVDLEPPKFHAGDEVGTMTERKAASKSRVIPDTVTGERKEKDANFVLDSDKTKDWLFDALGSWYLLETHASECGETVPQTHHRLNGLLISYFDVTKNKSTSKPDAVEPEAGNPDVVELGDLELGALNLDASKPGASDDGTKEWVELFGVSWENRFGDGNEKAHGSESTESGRNSPDQVEKKAK